MPTPEEMRSHQRPERECRKGGQAERVEPKSKFTDPGESDINMNSTRQQSLGHQFCQTWAARAVRHEFLYTLNALSLPRPPPFCKSVHLPFKSQPAGGFQHRCELCADQEEQRDELCRPFHQGAGKGGDCVGLHSSQVMVAGHAASESFFPRACPLESARHLKEIQPDIYKPAPT